MADRQGFEPWMGYSPMPVFKTGAFNRSAICPHDEMIEIAIQIMCKIAIERLSVKPKYD